MKHLAILGGAICLSGCAQFQGYGHDAARAVWGSAQSAGHSVAGLLRPGSRPDLHQDKQSIARGTPQMAAPDIAAFMRRYSAPDLESVGTARSYAMTRTHEAGVMVYRPDRYSQRRAISRSDTRLGRDTERAYRPTDRRAYRPDENPAQPFRAADLRPASNPYAGHASKKSSAPIEYRAELAGGPAPTQAPPQTSAGDISFVKMGGGSNIADWETCMEQAGTFAQPSEGGYAIDMNFEACMRAKGYLPENEAIAAMERAGL